ncbi:MAG: OmpA family protein [Clostridiales bacterium]|nr:OmpA family protein [Clostridiales bacterium]
MKYRVTTRGWIVFSIIGILLMFSLTSLIGGLSEEPINSTEDNSFIETEESTSETNNDNNTDDNTSSSSNEENSSGESNTSSEENTVDDDESSEDTIEETTTTETSDSAIEPVVDIDLNMRTEIFFDKNVFDLSSSYLSALEEWLGYLEKDDNLEITIEGHINGYPYYEDGKFGLELALNRATIISDYFTTNGVSQERISIINMGSTDQNDLSDNEEKHYLNRRAVIYLTEKP